MVNKNLSYLIKAMSQFTDGWQLHIKRHKLIMDWNRVQAVNLCKKQSMNMSLIWLKWV